MNEIKSDAVMNFDDFWDKLDPIIDCGRYNESVEIGAQIYLDIAQKVQVYFDEEQLGAIDAAREFWSGKLSEEERLRWLKKMIDRQDKLGKVETPFSFNSTVNRIASAPLYTTEGFGFQEMDYIILLAESIKLTVGQLDEIFRRRIPEYI